MRLDDVLLWKDDHILAVNKPAGLLSSPDGYNPALPHLTAALMPAHGELWVVHRLDRDTSGAIILARNAAAHRDLCQQFERRQVSKTYHALVVGNPVWERQVVELPLQVDGDRQHRTLVDQQNGKPACTRLRLLERLGSYALIEAHPETGRTHQIRVHLKALGLPVLVDGMYGDGEVLYLSKVKPNYRSSRTKPERPLLNRLGLHARSITIKHPISREDLSIEAAYPIDLVVALRQLRRYCRRDF
jgi:RluA family pseudouridine synthase